MIVASNGGGVDLRPVASAMGSTGHTNPKIAKAAATGSRYRPPPKGKKGKGKASSTDAKLKAMRKSIFKAMQAVVQEESDSDSSADSSDTEMDQHE